MSRGLISTIILPAPGHKPVEMTVELIDAAVMRIQATTYVYLLTDSESNRCSIHGAGHHYGWEE